MLFSHWKYLSSLCGFRENKYWRYTISCFLFCSRPVTHGEKKLSTLNRKSLFSLFEIFSDRICYVCKILRIFSVIFSAMVKLSILQVDTSECWNKSDDGDYLYKLLVYLLELSDSNYTKMFPANICNVRSFFLRSSVVTQDTSQTFLLRLWSIFSSFVHWRIWAMRLLKIGIQIKRNPGLARSFQSRAYCLTEVRKGSIELTIHGKDVIR